MSQADSAQIEVSPSPEKIPSLPVCVPLKTLIDLSLGTPEVGVVNFNLLHSLLHVIAKQLNIQYAKVEFRGEEGAAIRNLLESGQRGLNIQLSEYVIEQMGSQEELVAGSQHSGGESKTSETVTVVEKVDEEGEVVEESGSLKTPRGSGTSSEKPKGSVASVKSKSSSKRLSVATSSQYDILEKKVSSLEDKLSDMTPKNKDIIKTSKAGSKSVSEMWQMMSITARVETAEKGVNKLTSIIEDIALEFNKMAHKLGFPSVHVNMDNSSNVGEGESKEDIDNLRESSASSAVRRKSRGKSSSENVLDGSRSIMDLIDEILQDFDYLKGEVKELSHTFTTFKSNLPEELIDEQNSTLNVSRISGIDTKFCEINEAITRIDNAFNNQMNIYQDHITDLENEVIGVWQSLNQLSALESQTAGVGEFATKAQAAMEEIEAINGKISKLIDDKDEKTLRINMILEEVDVLKNIKADRREIEDALEDKADISTVNLKVSITQFDIAFSTLSESLNEAHTKLNNQEIVIRNAMEELHQELELKMNSADLTPITDEIHQKLKRLHERLKVIEKMKRDAEAAGTKSKYLKDVNCISCDNKVLMLKQEGAPVFPVLKPLPQHSSLSPQICYDMDKMRKAGRYDKEMEQGNMHLCNRYCGGSHTMTTAQQRVRRGGNFMDQFSMQGIPMQTARTGSGVVMKDQAIMARLSAEARASVAQPLAASSMLGLGSKRPSAVSTKEETKRPSLTSRKSTEPQTVAAPEAPVEGVLEEETKPPSRTPSKQVSGEKIPTQQTSAEKVSSSKRSSAEKISSSKRSSAEKVVEEAAAETQKQDAEEPPQTAVVEQPTKEVVEEQSPTGEAPVEEAYVEEQQLAEDGEEEQPNEE